MTRKRYNLFLGETTLKSLQTVAKKQETTVSELIRRAIRSYYGGEKAKTPQQQVSEASSGDAPVG